MCPIGHELGAILIKKTLVFSLFSLSCLSAFATTPDAVVSDMSGHMLERISAAPSITADQLKGMVEELVMPHVDFETLTAHTAGKYWREATPEQKIALQSAFRALLLKTYASAMQHAAGATMQMLPSRTTDATSTLVRSLIKARGQQEPLALSYQMEVRGDDWKVVDVSVMGVWLVAAYKESFAQQISRGGIDGLIRALQEKAAHKG